MIIRVSRGKGERYVEYNVEVINGITVLDLLFQIQEDIDPTLTFRYSCRGAVCGSCAVLVNGIPVLACKTPVSRVKNLGGDDQVTLSDGKKVPDGSILIEPIPKLPVIKDLIVDWEPFFREYRQLEPVLKINKNPPEKEFLMENEDKRELEKYTNCILCALCWTACPVIGDVEGYPGPAALAKLFRFHLDPRESNNIKRLSFADRDNGWWACDFHTKCKEVCPKGVPPNIAIGKARKELKSGVDRK
ncbi:MAG: succinate dehydrogenase/fumarate reductase iron-sulfur subunit [Bacillota bacterium]